MAKIKNNQKGGAILAKDPKAAAMQLEKNQETEGGARKGAAKGMDHKKGGAKYVDGAAKYIEGAADFPKKGTQEHKASVKHSESGEHLGAKRMGYNQSFGAARVSGYSKGAAKVADIMSFGASKYKSHGAADAGHGVPDGHNHPSMTTKSRSTSGGGSSSSSSSTSGGSGTSGVSYSSAYNNADKTKYPTLGAFTDAAKAYNASNSSNSSNSSTSSNAGSSTTSSNTITSPESMEEGVLQDKISNENLKQSIGYKKALTNIAVARDSSSTAQNYIKRFPVHKKDDPKIISNAGRKGGIAAATGRIASGNFSRGEAKAMFKAGQSR